MTEQLFCSIFPLLPPGLLISYWREANRAGIDQNALLAKVGIHQWLIHLGFISDSIVRDVVDFIADTYSPSILPNIVIVDHRYAIIGIMKPWKQEATTHVISLQPDVSPGQVVTDVSASILLRDAETTFTLFPSRMMSRLRSIRDRIEKTQEAVPKV